MGMSELEVLKSLSLLYVEDDDATREELAMMLEPWLGALHVAADGQAGLDLFKARRPDIVLTDIQMPRVSGLAMSAEIRRLVPDQLIVVVSAYNDVEYLFRAIELGIDQYVTKPINVERLLDKLAQMTDVLMAVKERRRSHVQLEQYKKLLDLSAIVCRIDLSGRITHVNDSMCAISGHGQGDLIGTRMADLCHDNEACQRWEAAFAQARSGQKWAGILRNRTRDGAIYMVQSNLIPMLDELGEVTELVSLDVDITPV